MSPDSPGVEVVSEQSVDREERIAKLIADWHRNAVAVIREGRIKKGLTQAEVARRMGTGQSAIARIENGGSGGISVRHYIAYALACEQVPFPLEYISIDRLLEYAAENPGAPMTKSAIEGHQST